MHATWNTYLWTAVLFTAPAFIDCAYSKNHIPCVVDYESIQAAVDHNPGQAIYIPAGDYLLTDEVSISSDGTELFGHGRLIQQNPKKAVVRIHDAKHVTLRGLTLTRVEGRETAESEALRVDNTSYVTIDEANIANNRAKNGALTMTDSQHATIRDCLILNYSRIAIDDRTSGNDGRNYGYAFNCIDGTGIVVSQCRDVLIEGNRVIEEFLQATPEMKSTHRLGEFVDRNPMRGALVSEETWRAGYVNNWHQGSAIIVSSAEQPAHVRLLNNHIENAAQGIDIHADHVTVQGNMVINAFVGMKAMHGSRYTLIANNHFSKSVLWAIGLMPGASSRLGNEDGDSIISGNIISEFGYGDAAWIWPHDRYTCVPIKLERGQERNDPPLRNVVITGNVIAASYPDEKAEDTNQSESLPPRYKWALLIDSGRHGPKNVTVSSNHFPPGTEGVSNRRLD